VAEARVPLAEDVRTALTLCFEMLWEKARPEVSAGDWAAYQRLCQPRSPDFILNLPDYYGFVTYSLFWRRVPG